MLMPRIAQVAMNTSFRMFTDSAAEKDNADRKDRLSPDPVAMQQMMHKTNF